jgi:O-antigen ligase
MWQQTIDGIVHVPLFGTGLGTFEQAYPHESSVPVPFLIDKAHNTYLEHALELGIPASLMFYTGFFALFLLCWRQRHRAIPAVGAASMAMVGTHALVDFSMQLPAVAMMFSVILGTACARACHVPTLISHSISRDIISEPNALDKVRPKLHGISETNHMRTGELL